jgi:hypothetical protein
LEDEASVPGCISSLYGCKEEAYFRSDFNGKLDGLGSIVGLKTLVFRTEDDEEDDEEDDLTPLSA